MNYREIVELKKRMDFNLTEAETLVKLVQEAQLKGEKAQKDMERLREVSVDITKDFEMNDYIRDEGILKDVSVKTETGVGIDGSFQLVGGIGGIWYAPISVARVTFDRGLSSQPRVDIFWAGIQEVKEQVEHNIQQTAAVMMLSAESKALLDWGTSGRQGIVFIDGPIVDPPVYGDREYVKDRCEAIEKCLSSSILVGCVKRSRDIFLIEFLGSLKTPSSGYLSNFPSDQHLMLYVFGNLRRRNYSGALFTKWIDISKSNRIFELYANNGIYVTSCFFQKSKSSAVLRLDAPFLEPPSENQEMVEKRMTEIVRVCSDWTYPGHDYPAPVFLAHDKCNIREGCAQVLYEDIITKSTSVDPLNQILITQLR